MHCDTTSTSTHQLESLAATRTITRGCQGYQSGVSLSGSGVNRPGAQDVRSPSCLVEHWRPMRRHLANNQASDAKSYNNKIYLTH